MRFSKCGSLPAAAIFAVAGVLLLAACQTSGMQDSSGRGTVLSEWRKIDVSEVDLNLPILLPQKITDVESQIRDNRLYHHRLRLDGGKGVVITQHIWDAWYDDRTQNDAADIELFRKKVAKVFGGELVNSGEIRAVERKGKKTAGFATVVDVRNPAKGKCFYSSVGYRVKGRTSYDNDFGNVDTFVEIYYCDPKAKYDDFSHALEEIALVKDREKFKAALAAK